MNPKMTGPTAAYRGLVSAISNVTPDPENPRKFSITVTPFYFRGEYTGGNFQIIPEYVYDPKGLLKNVNINDLLNPDKVEALANTVSELQTYANELNTPEFSRETISGSGPYQLKEWVTDEKIVLEKKEDWWGDGYAKDNGMFEAYPRQIIYRPMRDATPAVAMLQNGTLDATYQLSLIHI